MPQLAVIGHLSRDVIAGAPPRIGGGAWHCGRAFAELGADATIVAACARDDEGWSRKQLDELGLPFELHHTVTTTAFSFSYDTDGVRRMRIDAIGEPFTAEVDAEWVLVAPLVRGDVAIPSAPHVLLDGQGLVRRPQLGPLRLDSSFDQPRVEIVKLAEEEAAIAGPLDVPEVVVTHGVRGATVNGVHVPVDPVDADPTGAGDMFAAGYLAARAGGAEPVEAARYACDVVPRMLSR